MEAVRRVAEWATSAQSYSTFKNIAAVVGVVYASEVLFRHCWKLMSGFRAYFLAPRGLAGLSPRQYRACGQWAVVTGASEGIGRCYALELARRGLNVVIMSRSQEKLQKVADEIKAQYDVEVMVIAVDFSSGQEIYPQLAQQLKNLDIGVLINNVGMSHPQGPDWFLSVSEEALYRLVTVNCQACVQMTHMLLPKMLEKKMGIIVNLSTIGSHYPNAMLAVYGASKTFINFFTDAIRSEYGGRGIIIQSVMPGLVVTPMSHVRRPTYWRPAPDTYTRQAVATIGVQNTTLGYLPHAFQFYIYMLFPRRYAMHHGDSRMRDAQKKLAARQAAAASTKDD